MTRNIRHYHPHPRPNPYHRLSIAEKQAVATERQREPAIMCPSCDTQTTPTDLLRHVAERCTGPREPGPAAKWVGWREALATGVPRETLSRWASDGLVRFKGERMERRYSLRDLVYRMAQRRAGRRR